MVSRAKVAFILLGCLVLSGTGHASTDPQAQALAQVQEEARKGKYRLIAPETIRTQFLKNPASLFLVDTRQEWEYQREHIQDAVNLPVAPGVMVGEEIVVEVSDIQEDELEAVICRHLGLPPPEPQKKRLLGRLFK